MKTKIDRRSQRGSSMVFALLILAATMALGVAGLQAAASGLTLSNNYRAGVQALQAAEAGIIHAVGYYNANGGVTNSFATEVAGPWSSGFGTTTKTMPGNGNSNVTWTTTPATSPWPAATADNMWITATGSAVGQSQRVVYAKLGKTGPFTCGAIDLPNTGLTANFQGNAFQVDGHDYAIGANSPTAGATSTLGISTRTASDASAVINGLNSQELDNVQGTTVPNQIPSIGTCVGPSASRIQNTIVPAMLAQPGVQTSTDNMINGNATFGSVSSPQVTYFNGDTEIKANGNASGAGIMIVNGGLTIQGSFSFTGLIIVTGTTQITSVTGNALVYGAIWTTDLNLSVGGSAAVRYSNAALQLANGIPTNTQQVLPQRIAVVAWSLG